MLPVNTVLTQYLFLSVSCFLFWAPMQLSVKLVLLPAFPVTLETHKEARNRGRLWVLSDLTVMLLPPPSLFFIRALHPFFSAQLAECPCLSFLQKYSRVFTSDTQLRKPKTQRGNDLSSALSLVLPPLIPELTEETGWSRVHVITVLPL